MKIEIDSKGSKLFLEEDKLFDEEEGSARYKTRERRIENLKAEIAELSKEFE